MGSQLSSAMRSTTAICLILIGAVLTLVEAKPKALWPYPAYPYPAYPYPNPAYPYPYPESTASFGKPCLENGEAGCRGHDDCCMGLACIMIGIVGKDIGKCSPYLM